jgi:hypothetical protein
MKKSGATCCPWNWDLIWTNAFEDPEWQPYFVKFDAIITDILAHGLHNFCPKKKRLLNSLWMTFCTLDLSIYTYTTLYKHSLNWPNPQIRNTDLILQLVAWRSKPKNPQPVSSMMDVSGHSVSNLSWYHPCGIRGFESKMIQQIMIWINHNKSIISFNML